MKVIAYFLYNKLWQCEIEVLNVTHLTYDISPVPGSPTEICLGTSKSTVKNEDDVKEILRSIKIGSLVKREFDAELIYKEWKEWQISFTTLKSEEFLPDPNYIDPHPDIIEPVEKTYKEKEVLSIIEDYFGLISAHIYQWCDKREIPDPQEFLNCYKNNGK